MAKKPTKLVKDVNEAINKGLARFLTSTQSKLSAAAPVDTGRLASSFFVGENMLGFKSPWDERLSGFFNQELKVALI